MTPGGGDDSGWRYTPESRRRLIAMRLDEVAEAATDRLTSFVYELACVVSPRQAPRYVASLEKALHEPGNAARFQA